MCFREPLAVASLQRRGCKIERKSDDYKKNAAIGEIDTEFLRDSPLSVPPPTFMWLPHFRPLQIPSTLTEPVAFQDTSRPYKLNCCGYK